MPKVSINQRLAYMKNKAINTQLEGTKAFAAEVAAMQELFRMAGHHVAVGDPVGAAYRMRQIACMAANAATQMNHIALTFAASIGAGVDMMSRRTPRDRKKMAEHLQLATNKEKAQKRKGVTLAHQRAAYEAVKRTTTTIKNSGPRRP